MTDFGRLTDDLATATINERRAAATRSRVPGERRPHGRHALARSLHRVAERLDALGT